jgi:hypothetical protein
MLKCLMRVMRTWAAMMHEMGLGPDRTIVLTSILFAYKFECVSVS